MDGDVHVGRARLVLDRQVSVGRTVADIRRAVAGGQYDGQIDADLSREMYAAIQALRPDQMPPPAPLVHTLVEILKMRRGYSADRYVWSDVGLTQYTGYRLLQGEARTITWPLWYTLKTEAFAP